LVLYLLARSWYARSCAWSLEVNLVNLLEVIRVYWLNVIIFFFSWNLYSSISVSRWLKSLLSMIIYGVPKRILWNASILSTLWLHEHLRTLCFICNVSHKWIWIQFFSFFDCWRVLNLLVLWILWNNLELSFIVFHSFLAW
jgi:hypothetical protein